MARAFELFPYKAGMHLQFRKKHPCGGDSWRLIYVGSDARLECDTCHHQVQLSRRALEKATKAVLSEPSEEEAAEGQSREER